MTNSENIKICNILYAIFYYAMLIDIVFLVLFLIDTKKIRSHEIQLSNNKGKEWQKGGWFNWLFQTFKHQHRQLTSGGNVFGAIFC